MSTELAVAAAALLLPVLAVPVSAASGRWGILPLLVPRRARWWWRYRRLGFAPPRGRQRSSRITRKLRARVMIADRHRCAVCGERAGVQVDHIIPWSVGGVGCLWNCMLLCPYHNQVKSNYWTQRPDRLPQHLAGPEGGTAGGEDPGGRARPAAVPVALAAGLRVPAQLVTCVLA